MMKNIIHRASFPNQTYLAKTPVPIISNMTTVHNLSEKISEIFPGNTITCLKVIVKHVLTYDKVASVEGIRFIPAL